MSNAATLAEATLSPHLRGHAARATSDVVGAVRQASLRTGVDFAYLLDQAAVESGLDPNAKARTSSATGLYQFIEQTWLGMVDRHGAEHGMGDWADAITVDRRGRYRVADPDLRREILDGRKDPTKAAAMAGEFAAGNAEHLARTVGGRIGETELYLAHFLGAGGASEFLNALNRSPERSAASVAPEAARANRSIFYDRAGRPRSLEQVYDLFARKFGDDGRGAGVVGRPDPASATVLAAGQAVGEAVGGAVAATRRASETLATAGGNIGGGGPAPFSRLSFATVAALAALDEIADLATLGGAEASEGRPRTA